MQYIVVGIVAVTVGLVLGYWIKALKYRNEKEPVKTDSNVKEQAEIKDMKQKYDEVKARLDRAIDKYKDLMVEMANDRFKRMLKKNRADSIATVTFREGRDLVKIECLFRKDALSTLKKHMNSNIGKEYISFKKIQSKVQGYKRTYWFDSNPPKCEYWIDGLTEPQDGAVDWIVTERLIPASNIEGVDLKIIDFKKCTSDCLSNEINLSNSNCQNY